MTDPATSDDPPRPARRRRLAGTLTLLVAAVVSPAVVACGGDDETSAAEVLADARAALDGGGVRFLARIERARPEGPDGTGTPAVAVSTEEGEWAGGVSHVVVDRAPWSVETVVTPDAVLTRTGNPIDDGTPWAPVEAAGADYLDLVDEVGPGGPGGTGGSGGTGDDAVALLVAQELYLAGGDPEAPRARLFGAGAGAGGAVDVGDLAGVDPTRILRAMERLGEPERDGDTITATLRAPDEWVDAYGAPLPEGRAELVLGSDDRPTAFRLRIAAGDATVEVEVAFDAWGEPVTVDVPDAAGAVAAADPGETDAGDAGEPA
ncbi:MAG TPA: hypothetical protein VIL36_05560 [Acidimicrobiales bacterium]